jgi:hypothetical protein
MSSQFLAGRIVCQRATHLIMLLTDTQTAAWLDHPHHGASLTLRNDIPIPEPSEGEVLVKLECSGFCHSDVHSIYGETAMETNIAGHEGVGRVIKRKYPYKFSEKTMHC